MAKAAKKSPKTHASKGKLVKVTNQSKRPPPTRDARRAASPPGSPAKGTRTAMRPLRTPIHKAILAYNAAQSAGDKRICDALARVIHQNLPGADNKIWHRHPVWFLDGNPVAVLAVSPPNRVWPATVR